MFKSDYAHTIIQHTPICPYTRTRYFGPDFQQLRPFYSLDNRHQVTISHPSSGDNIPEREGEPKERTAQQKLSRETQSSKYAPGFSTPSCVSRIVAQPPPPSLCCPRPPSRNSLNQTSVFLVFALYLHPPSIPFWPYGTHPFSPSAQIILIN